MGKRWDFLAPNLNSINTSVSSWIQSLSMVFESLRGRINRRPRPSALGILLFGLLRLCRRGIVSFTTCLKHIRAQLKNVGL